MNINQDKPIKKNEEYIVEIIDNGYEGEGIAKIDDFTIFINGAIKGEICKVLILKVNKNFAYGKILQIIEKSSKRISEDCSTYKKCGGCDLRHIDYKYTLNMKQEVVQNLVSKGLKSKVNVLPTIGMENPYNYRNKLQYPLGLDKNENPVMGVFAKRTHEIIPVENCFIQNKEAQVVANYIYEFIKQHNITVYNERNKKGQVRHIIIKIGIRTNQIMCIIVTNEEKLKYEKQLVEEIVKRFSNVKTIVKNINSENTNVILGKRNIILYGDGFILDELGEYTFQISPMSFYQTNPIQTEILYNKAIEYASLNQNDVLCDLYCGIGTIGIFASKYVKKVYGIEIVDEAIKSAEQNAKINKINNIEFIVGDVGKVFNRIIKEKKVKPTVIIVDPPRKGLDAKTIETIKGLKVSKIVYVSCNPSTMTRDLRLLEEDYIIDEIQPVDMFPFTSHVECCLVLSLK